MSEKVVVSILFSVYNHSKHLKRAIESVLKQKTDFAYEIVVGDDSSSDGSQSLLKAYERENPDIFNLTLRDENIGGTRNFTDLLKKCRGKYLTFIEGDDYWTCDNKLQIQHDFLENNHDYFSVSHRLSMRNEHDEFISITPSRQMGNAYSFTIDDFLHGERFPLTATMLRFEYNGAFDELSRMVDRGARNVGDTTLCIFFLDKSPVMVLNEDMAVYQLRSKVGESNYNSISSMYDKLTDRFSLLKLNDGAYSYNFMRLYMKLLRSIVGSLVRQGSKEKLKLFFLLVPVLALFLKSLIRR